MVSVSPTNNIPAGSGLPILERLFSGLTVSLFFLLPFHGFLVTWLRFGLHVPGPINLWKEALIATLFTLTAIGLVQRWRKQNDIWRITFDTLDISIFIFFGIGILSSILQYARLGDLSFIRIFYGFRYDFLILVVFLFFRHGLLTAPDLQRKVIRAILIAGVSISIFALLQATILPRDFLALFGYTPAFGTWSLDGPLATYQALSPQHPETVRAAGTFAGPNQFAMYCLVLVGLIGAQFAYVRSQGSQRNRLGWWFLLLGIAPVLGIVLSYSRSALIGLFGGTAIGFFLALGKDKVLTLLRRLRKVLITGVIVVAILLPSVLYFSPTTASYLNSIFVRENSSQGHYERSRDGVIRMLAKPIFGEGIGEAGPASPRVDVQGRGFLPENWYLQLGVEYGLPGLIAWLTILFLMAKELYKRRKLPESRLQPLALLFSFIAINIACLFLHAWEDSAVAITWWGLAGLTLTSSVRQ